MRVFILCTGRSGSSTFIKACTHITNYSSGHETRIKMTGMERVLYPDNHIESDNRLSWFLGALDMRYGKDAYYVHLIRNREQTAASFNKRWRRKGSIIRAFSESILFTPKLLLTPSQKLAMCNFYYDTVNANIALFLKDKTNKITVHLENVADDFSLFWQAIGAEGNFDKATQELNIKHNRS